MYYIGEIDFSIGYTLETYTKKNSVSHVNNYKTKLYFCTKYKATGERWGSGNYCTLQRSSNCPFDLSQSSIQWGLDNAFTYIVSLVFIKYYVLPSSGSIPQGFYSTSRIRINFCCSRGSNNDIIEIDSDEFYLIRKGGKCQYVKNMTSEIHYIKIKDKHHVYGMVRDITTYGSNLPDYGTRDAGEFVLYLCHYTKKKIDPAVTVSPIKPGVPDWINAPIQCGLKKSNKRVIENTCRKSESGPDINLKTATEKPKELENISKSKEAAVNEAEGDNVPTTSIDNIRVLDRKIEISNKELPPAYNE
ncbi:hypothetical protein A3Q56_05338 [Intoshia linei]|uniref:Apextrin C-terminal domain-containing protein n=1 Tax=Intoshia linei TaxID=1819745 RepID=A0A177AY46_9BILA|nr:hypothetical protein A3Q56_05338 [Intoshia linei]